MKKEKTILSEHVFEVRYAASGTFLDVRGYVADYIKECKLFPHWNIDANIVNFRDSEKKAKTDAAFIGYKSAGYTVFDVPTKNYFPDKSIKFWKTLNENNHYKIPELLRIGIRTKAFFPLDKSFEEIRDAIYTRFYTKESQALIGGSLDDLQLVIDYQEEGFKVFLRGGPLKKGEAAKYFNFESEDFKNSGLFLDLDFFKESNLNHNDIPQLLNKAVDISWKKLEIIARGLGF